LVVSTALAEVQAAWDDYRGGPAGEVSVLALPSTAEYLLPPVVARFTGSPIRLLLSDEDLAEEEWPRLTRDHDIAVGHSLSDRPRGGDAVETVRLAREPLDIALPARHPLARRPQLDPGDLVDEPWIGVPTGYPFDSVRLAVEEATGRRVDVVQRLRDNRLVEALVAQGIGLAVLPRFTTRPREDVVLRPLAGIDTARHVFAFLRPDRARRLAVRTVLDAIRESAAEVANRLAPCPAARWSVRLLRGGRRGRGDGGVDPGLDARLGGAAPAAPRHEAQHQQHDERQLRPRDRHDADRGAAGRGLGQGLVLPHRDGRRDDLAARQDQAPERHLDLRGDLLARQHLPVRERLTRGGEAERPRHRDVGV